MAQPNPFDTCLDTVEGGGKFYSLSKLNDPRIEKLPFSIRVLLESAVRNCDEFEVSKKDVENIINWEKTQSEMCEVPFKPARVILQDFTGVPAVVDLAAMRDGCVRLGGDPKKINPLVPVDLVIDHSVMVDFSRTPEALEKNSEMEYKRNAERFSFLKWGATAFNNMLICPPGSGIVHQVNLEYLARVVFDKDGMMYPDSVVGTDSHTTMIDGLGVVGWGVGGIEAEAVMLGQAISMVLPEVVGFKLNGKLPATATATDLVLTCTAMLRKRGVVGKFVEFFGEGCKNLSLADRATVANMSPEYGATMGFFPVDEVTLEYMRLTGRDPKKLKKIEAYLKANKLWQTYDNNQTYSGDVMELDLSTVVACVSGPKRPHDRVAVSDLPKDFKQCLTAPKGFKGFGLTDAQAGQSVDFDYKGKNYTLSNGSVVIAAITSCTNTSNPSVLLGAGMVAKKAVQKGLFVKPYIKTSLSPGSGAVDAYLKMSGLLAYLEQLGFFTAGFGCMTCIGNSGELDDAVAEAISAKDLCVSAVLSGNRNFEGRVHPQTQANYLASPPLVVAYALAGRCDIDFETEPIGTGVDGPVFLKDIWPTSEEIRKIEKEVVQPEMFRETYKKVAKGNKRWNELKAPKGETFTWDDKSTYIHNPPFFQDITMEPPAVKDINKAYALLNVGDSITTDHISPAGKIAKNSPAARYLMERGVEAVDFNSYGSRRGNDEIMARGTFANVRLNNKLVGKTGPQTVHIPSGETLDIFDAAAKYQAEGHQLIILGGKEYGSGSSRDWAAKGPYLQGVQAVIAESYERIHRSNLVGMGILPLQFKDGQNADSIGLTGREQFSLSMQGGDLKVGQDVKVTASSGKTFTATCRLDTPVEITYFKHRGILHYMLRKLAAQK